MLVNCCVYGDKHFSTSGVLRDISMMGFTTLVGEENKGHRRDRGEVPITHWTPAMNRHLIDLLLNQALGGNKIGHVFIPEAWTQIVAMFNVKFGCHYDEDALKFQARHLRRQYNDIKILLEQNGFSWDDTREMVIAEDYIWDAYMKVIFHIFLIFCSNCVMNCFFSLCNMCRHIPTLNHTETNQCLPITSYVLYLAKKVLMESAAWPKGCILKMKTQM